MGCILSNFWVKLSCLRQLKIFLDSVLPVFLFMSSSRVCVSF